MSALRVGMIGYEFMGAAHSQAWRTVNHAFDLPLTAELAVICGRDEARVAAAKPLGNRRESHAFGLLGVSSDDRGTPLSIKRMLEAIVISGLVGLDGSLPKSPNVAPAMSMNMSRSIGRGAFASASSSTPPMIQSAKASRRTGVAKVMSCLV